MHDVSRRISSDAVVLPGDDPLLQQPICQIGASAPCNITALQNWSTHFLTHVDPPKHFIPNGASLDDVPLERFAGKAKVVECASAVVTEDDLRRAGNIENCNVLFKTRNSNVPTTSEFDENHVYLSEGGAVEATRNNANLLGIDYLTIDKFDDDNFPAHITLLGNNVLILEGLDLSGVPEGEYDLYALPLKIAAGDGSPVRAVLT